MISRRTAIAIAEVYCLEFISVHRWRVSVSSPYITTYRVEEDRLFDFLFTNNYEAWLCNLSRKTYASERTHEWASRLLKRFIMLLHTGETLAEITPEWTWQQRQLFGLEQLKKLATDILILWYSKDDKTREALQSRTEKISNLLRSLELDGYVYQNSCLLILESDILDTKEEAGLLQSLYTTLELGNKKTAFHHLELSEEHYVNSKWDDSISNSRKFLECVLQEVAGKHSLKFHNVALANDLLSRPVEVRKYFEKENLLDPKEIEALRGAYSLLSETGGHPYMAQNDQARLLRHLALTFAQFVMLRLQGKIKSKA